MKYAIEYLSNGYYRLTDTECQWDGLYNADGSFRSGQTSASVPHLDPILRELAYTHGFKALCIYYDAMIKSGANLALGMSTSGKLSIVNAATIGPNTFTNVYCLPQQFKATKPQTYTAFITMLGDCNNSSTAWTH